MALHLTDAERAALRALQRQHRDGPGYVQVTVVVLFDKGRSVPHIADDLGLDPATVYRYAAAYQTQGLTAWLHPEAGGYWGADQRPTRPLVSGIKPAGVHRRPPHPRLAQGHVQGHVLDFGADGPAPPARLHL